MTDPSIALQLYTVRELTAKDFPGTLSRLAEQGYSAVELAGYSGLAVRDLRAALDANGLQAVGAHVPYPAFETRLDEALAELHTLGCGYATLPWLSEELRPTSAEQVRRLAATFDRWAERCRTAGVRFGYHNHAFEFAPLDGSTVFNLLADLTDPDLVDLELDVYWAAYAGVDPIALIERYPGRMPLLHLKDMAAGEGRSDAAVGEGTLPWARLLAAARVAGTRWYIIEQDHPRDALADVATSLHNVKRLFATVDVG